eukprot:3614818-Amphidinium_carterae.1
MQNPQQLEEMRRILAHAHQVCRACLALRYDMEYDAATGGPMGDAPEIFRIWLAMSTEVYGQLRSCFEGQYQIGG